MPRPTCSRADFGWRRMLAVNTSTASSKARRLQQVVAPVEQVLLGRRHVRGALIAAGGRDEVARALFDVAEQVEELGGLLGLEHPPHLLARRVQLAGLEVGEGEVVAVGVVGRVDGAGALEVREGGVELAGLQVERAERVLRVEAVGRAAHGLQEAALDRRRAGRCRAARRLGRRLGRRRVGSASGRRARPRRGRRGRARNRREWDGIDSRWLRRHPDPIRRRRASRLSATSRTSRRAESAAACCACW